MYPFVKWAGGKRQLLNEIQMRLPIEYGDYYEPFVGGGALLFELAPKKAVINDLTTELIDTYITIRDNHDALIEKLLLHQHAHKNAPEEYYYKMRALDRDDNWKNQSKLTKTSRFMYLNKSCFNGLYRVNSKGFFNVPFNKKSEINIFNEDNLKEIHQYLKNSVDIYNKDFYEVAILAKKGDFVFFDPPYDLLKKDTFDSYTKDAFGEEGQRRLAELFHKLSDRGCYLMLTNHNTTLINELYANYNIEVVQVKRMINSDSKNRKGEEVIITNYER